MEAALNTRLNYHWFRVKNFDSLASTIQFVKANTADRAEFSKETLSEAEDMVRTIFRKASLQVAAWKSGKVLAMGAAAAIVVSAFPAAAAVIAAVTLAGAAYVFEKNNQIDRRKDAPDNEAVYQVAQHKMNLRIAKVMEPTRLRESYRDYYRLKLPNRTCSA